MGFPAILALLPQIVQLVVPTVQTVERIIRGSKRGPEKREAAVREVVEKIQAAAADPNQANAFDWLQLLQNIDVLTELVGNIVDSVVALMNFLGSFSNSDDDSE